MRRARLLSLDEVRQPETERGVQACHNLTLGVANSIAAMQAGARGMDTSLAAMGAGAGNTPLEILVAAAHKMRWQHGCDVIR
jgi:4-hydroxy 2-oxovalerate aldolase